MPPLGDPLIFDIERRAANLAGNYNHSQSEDFQVACYDPGQYYGLHRDDADVVGLPSAKDRVATVLIYLQSPEEGGETLFTRRLNTEAGALKLFKFYCNKPRKKFVVVSPAVGTAVTWPNWYGKSNDQFASRSTHGACR